MRRLFGLVSILSMSMSIWFAPVGYSGDEIPLVSGEIKNIKVSSASIDAGQSVTVTFDVALTTSTSTNNVFTVAIAAAADENGDTWTDEVWTAQPTLVSGDQSRGSWSAQVTVAATAFTGEYTVWVGSNSKLVNARGASVNIQINGTPKPVFVLMKGTVSNIATDRVSINAGEKVSITYDLELLATPTNFEQIRTWIGALPDENGDSWTSEQWSSAISTRISGSELKGRWSTEITIPTTAFTGSYVASVIVPNKLITVVGGRANLQIVGVSKPVVTPLSGSAFAITSKSTVFEAGKTYDFEFNVSLNQIPNNPILFAGYVSAALDENGEPSTSSSELWNKGQLISGDYGKGNWKVPITFPANMYSGTYVFKVSPPNKLISVPANGFTFNLSGLTPIPRFVPTYVFSNQNLSPNKVLAGAVIKASFTLKSNDARVSTPECIMDGATEGWVKAKLISGSAMDGNWECVLEMGKSTPPGKYDFHMAVVGYANDEKNEERVILPVTVVANEEELYGPFADAVYMDTANPLSSGAISSDRVSTILDYKPGKVSAYLYIPPGKGNILATVSGPGILGTTTGSPLGKALLLNRSFINGTSLYLFSDGLFGRSTVTLTLNGKTFTKQVEFYSSVPGISGPISTPSATPTATPTPMPTPSNSATSSPNPIIKASPTPMPSPSISINSEPKPASEPLPSLSPTPSPLPTPSVTGVPLVSKTPTPIATVKTSIKPSASPTPTKSSALRKLTITCIKGKLTKKVTTVKPVCPTGYKKK